MIKQVFFAGALVVPVLAHAGTPSATLPGQIVPAGQDPTPPPQAAAAGFTTLLANFDPANSGQMCVGKNCVAASPASNWLDCSGGDASKIFHVYTGPCNAGVAVDPVTGKLSLFVKWLSSYTPGTAANAIATISGSILSMTWPQGGYTDASYRIDNSWSGNTFGGGAEAPYWWQTNTPCVIDFQLGELYPGANGVGSADSGEWCPPGGGRDGQYTWQSYAGNSLPAGWAPTALHTYGSLRTTNGSNSYMECSYVDDIFQVGAAGGCFNNYSSTNPVIHGARSFMILGIAEDTTGPSHDLTLWIPWIRVWSCATGASGECNGTTLTGTPGSGLAFWH